MSDRRARIGADEAGDAGVAEQVQHPRAVCAGLQTLLQPRPVGGLFRKDRQMAKGGEAAVKPDPVPAHRPGVSRLGAKPPVAGLVLIGGIEHRIGRGPGVGVQARRPKALGFGANQPIGAAAFQLLAVAAVDQAIVRPAARAHDDRARGDDGF